MGSADLIEADGPLETTAGAEAGSAERTEKYFLELNGTLIDGYQPDDVARGLARLLRLTREQAQQLLQGKPYRIQKELDKDKAEHLLAKMVARGAGAIVVPVHHLQRQQPVSGQRTPIESDTAAMRVAASVIEAVSTQLPEAGENVPESVPEFADAPVELTLELDPGPAGQDQEAALAESSVAVAGPSSSLTLEPSVIESDDEVTRPMGRVGPDDLEVEEQVVLETPGTVARRPGTEEDEDPGQFIAQPPSPTIMRERDYSVGSGKTARRIPDKRLLAALGGVLALAAVGWGIQQFVEGSRPEPVVLQPVASPVDSRLASTRSRQDRLTRSVKVWMIEYGSGFNPNQVTLSRLQADLAIASQEMLDGWGTAFRYQPGEKRYTLTSAGPDRQFGTDDDLQRIETVE